MKILLLCLLFASCATKYPNQNPLGKTIPIFKGTALNDKKWSFPRDIKGKKTLLLIAYKQDTQFDVDRWLIGLDMTKTPVEALEIPTIQGLFPRMFKSKIDAGMKKGIPDFLWGGVVTVYKDADIVQKFTGNENPNNTRVLLIDDMGKILYFYDKGFSVPALNELRKKILAP